MGYLQNFGKYNRGNYKKLVELGQEIYTQGVSPNQWPTDFTRSISVPITKNLNIKDCKNYRTFSIITHASNILLKITTRQIESKAKGNITNT